MARLKVIISWLEPVLYAVMLMLVCMYFAGGGQFIYEG